MGGPVGALFDLSGTATRRRALAVLALSLAIALGYHLAAGRYPAARILLVPAAGLWMVHVLVIMVRRLHDAGRSGLWAVAALVPFAGPAACLVIAAMPRRQPYRLRHPAARAAGSGALALLALLALSRLFWTPLWVTAASGKPGILVGDCVAVLYAGRSAPDRGDLVAFRHPLTGQEQILRLIGLPGDRISLRGGIVHLNGAALALRPDGTFVERFERQGPKGIWPRCRSEVGEGGACTADRLAETLPDGRSYEVLNLADRTGLPDDMAEVTVPEGSYFLLGDNRDSAADSRFAPAAGGVGLVPAASLVGRARLVLFSASGRHLLAVWTWRPGRILMGLR